MEEARPETAAAGRLQKAAVLRTAVPKGTVIIKIITALQGTTTTTQRKRGSGILEAAADGDAAATVIETGIKTVHAIWKKIRTGLFINVNYAEKILKIFIQQLI